MNKAKILIIDDEIELMEMVSLRLQASGYQVSLACDGQEGLDKARNDPPDLIILDLMLPKIDGYKLCRMLKLDAKCKKIPIILFTARTQACDIKLGEEAGADDYLGKPFEPDILLAKIKQLLKSGDNN